MRHHITATCLALGGLAALTGCSSTPEPGPVFDNEGGRELTCLVHQTAEPGSRYTDPAMRNTGETLALLRYYTAHGAKSYCDGAPPSETDRAWARTYVALGGGADRVTPILR